MAAEQQLFEKFPISLPGSPASHQALQTYTSISFTKPRGDQPSSSSSMTGAETSPTLVLGVNSKQGLELRAMLISSALA